MNYPELGTWYVDNGNWKHIVSGEFVPKQTKGKKVCKALPPTETSQKRKRKSVHDTPRSQVSLSLNDQTHIEKTIRYLLKYLGARE